MVRALLGVSRVLANTHAGLLGVAFSWGRSLRSVSRLVSLGLVEGGSERPPGFRASCIREEIGPRPVGLPGEPSGGARQHSAAAGAD